MEGAERDSTQDWLIPASQSPPTIGELELRVDEALAIARSSEQAVGLIGDTALEAAQQAGRAAELAESASAAALEAKQAVLGKAAASPAAASQGGPVEGGREGWAAEHERIEPRPPGNGLHQDRLRRFAEHADRVAARLQAI